MKNSMRHTLCVALLAGSAACFAAPSYAQNNHSSFHGHSGPHGAPPAGSAPHWSGANFSRPHMNFAPRTNFAHFSPAQHSAWVGGRWNHAWHNGHFGWWWFAGGSWFFYDSPIYPYPAYVSDEYSDDGYSDQDYGGQYWYYCQRPAGYYPYVQQCSSPWQPVPPTPPPGGYGPPPGYQQGPGDQGPPPGYQQGPDDQGPPPNDDRYPDYQGPPPGGPGPGNQGPPPPGPGNGSNN